METACAELMDQIPTAEIVVLSKFGKLEAMQRGLWATFAAAKAHKALRLQFPQSIWMPGRLLLPTQPGSRRIRVKSRRGGRASSNHAPHGHTQ